MEAEKFSKSEINNLNNQKSALKKAESKITLNDLERNKDETFIKTGKESEKTDKNHTLNLNRQISLSKKTDLRLRNIDTESSRMKFEKRNQSSSPTRFRQQPKNSVNTSNIKRSTFEKSLALDEIEIHPKTNHSISNHNPPQKSRIFAEKVYETGKNENKNHKSNHPGTSNTNELNDVSTKKMSLFDKIGTLWVSDKPKNSINTIAEDAEEEPNKDKQAGHELNKVPSKNSQNGHVLVETTKQTGEINEKQEKIRKLWPNTSNESSEKLKQHPPLTSSKGKPLWAPSSNQSEQNVFLKKSMGIEITPKKHVEVKEKSVPLFNSTTSELKVGSNGNVTTSKQVPKNKKIEKSESKRQEKDNLSTSFSHPNMMKMETKVEKPERSLWEKLKVRLFGKMENDSGDESDLILEEPSQKSRSSQVKSKCNVLHVMQPLNVKEEEKFFKSDFKYNPQFTYSNKLTAELVQKYNIASSKYLEIVSF